MFEQREDGFERAFVHDEALRFKAMARRNRLIGLWAAQLIGLEGAAAEVYAAAMVEAEVGAADDEKLIGGLMAALAKVEPPVSERRLRLRLDEAQAEAVQQIQAGR